MHVRTEFSVAAPAARVWQELSDPVTFALAIGGDDMSRLDGGSGFTGTLHREFDGASVDCVATVRPIDTDEDTHTITCQLHVRETGGPGVALGMLRGQISGGNPGALVSVSLEGRVGAPGLDHSSLEIKAQSVIASIATELESLLTKRALRDRDTAAAEDHSATRQTVPATAQRTATVGLTAAVALLAAAALLVLGLRRRRRRSHVTSE